MTRWRKRPYEIYHRTDSGSLKFKRCVSAPSAEAVFADVPEHQRHKTVVRRRHQKEEYIFENCTTE